MGKFKEIIDICSKHQVTCSSCPFIYESMYYGAKCFFKDTEPRNWTSPFIKRSLKDYKKEKDSGDKN